MALQVVVDGLRAAQLAEVEVVLHLEGPDVAVDGFDGVDGRHLLGCRHFLLLPFALASTLTVSLPSKCHKSLKCHNFRYIRRLSLFRT